MMLSVVTLAGRLWPVLVVFGASIPSSTKNNGVRVGPLLTKLSGSAHDCSSIFLQGQVGIWDNRRKTRHFVSVSKYSLSSIFLS